jgi:eukaryotic-like serine/threonine-protein kinase
MANAPLTPQRLALLQQHFEQALALNDDARADALQRLDHDDPPLAARVRGLLAAHARTGSGLESPISLDPLPATDHDRWIGRRVGAYDITRCLGVGGMGAVYEAVRADDQFRQRVAIKLVRAFTMSDVAVRRFRRERQILASLTHPHIAALLDGGVTTDGHPYFAMEYIDGAPLTSYCDARQLPVAARLALFRQVCAAVEFAHQNLVVHRDLKPHNILVAADGQTKLLDFGIAALLPSALDSDDDETLTRAGTRPLTPGYASPEQRLGQSVGTLSDVYSLGVVLYELLSGRRPYEAMGATPADPDGALSGRTPSPPSAAITAERLEQLAVRSAEQARTRIAGDLDAIVLKALRTEPERRYGSAAEFSADILRHLEGKPVLARPDSVGYRITKFVRRRRVETAAAVVAVLSLAGGTALAQRQARAAEREATRAQAQETRATEVTRFLTTMLGAANPGVLGRDVKVREVLDSAVARADALTAQPALEAEVRMVIGGTFLALGEFARADEEYERALKAHRRATGGEGGRGAAVALSQWSMSKEFQGQLATADTLLRQADTLFARHGFDDLDQRISHVDARGRLLSYLGNTNEAETVYLEALALQRLQSPPVDSSLAASYTNLAVVQSDLGNNTSAETLMIAAVAAARRAYGVRHPFVASILSPLAGVQDRAGKPMQAESTYMETIAMRRELLGDDHPDLAWSMYNLADVLFTQRRFSESTVWLRRVLAMRGKSLADEHQMVSASLSLLGRALDGLDSLDAGGRALRESLALRERVYPAGHFLLASSRSQIGAHLVLQERFEEAEQLLLDSERTLLAARGEAAPIVKDARTRIVMLYEKWRKPDSLKVWQVRLARSAGGN